MMVLLLPLFWLLIFFILNKRTFCWRTNYLQASVIFGVVILIVTELLSLFSLLTYQSLMIAWSAIDIVLFLFYKIARRKTKINFFYEIKKFSPVGRLMIVSIVSLLIITGIIAFVSPPNNGDSMSYHMSRVAHWIQNKNIKFFPTHDLRQLFHNPWAEYAILHFQILNQGDYQANLIQWWSYLGCIIGVTLIAKRLGATIYGQIISGIVMATLPMAILQSSSTQNDLVVSLWLICSSFFILNQNIKPIAERLWLNTFFVGLSLGLAILTKGTAYVYAVPLLALFLYGLVRNNAFKAKYLLFIFTIAMILNSGLYIRNYGLFGSILGPNSLGTDDISYANSAFTIPLFISNNIKNLSLHIGTPFEKVNILMEKQIINIHKLLKIDINDPRITWGGSVATEPKFHIVRLSNHEDSAGSPLHVLLIIILSVIIILNKRINKHTILFKYFIFVSLSFMLFDSVFRWQIWNSRLHLPFFVLWSPIMGIVIVKLIKNNIILLMISFVFIFTSLPSLFINWSRPLIAIPMSFYDKSSNIVSKNIYLPGKNILNTDRLSMYFVGAPNPREQYIKATEYIKNIKCDQIGILNSGNEYQLWILLQRYIKKIIIEHVNVNNASTIYYKNKEFDHFYPCVLISLRKIDQANIFYKEMQFTLKQQMDPVYIYQRI